MKKLIALLAIVALIATTGIIAVGKKLPSVGYVLVAVSYTHLTLPTILLV